jgi:arsenate reductase-like glutaredoxin family protein
VEGVLSTRSPAYKARGLDAKTLTRAQAIELMLEDANLIRRPLVLKGKKAVFGYAPAEYDSLE